MILEIAVVVIAVTHSISVLLQWSDHLVRKEVQLIRDHYTADAKVLRQNWEVAAREANIWRSRCEELELKAKEASAPPKGGS